MKSLDNEEDLLKSAIVVFKMLSIDGLTSMKSYYDEYRSNSGGSYWKQSPNGLSYGQFKNIIGNGFMNSLQ